MVINTHLVENTLCDLQKVLSVLASKLEDEELDNDGLAMAIYLDGLCGHDDKLLCE